MSYQFPDNYPRRWQIVEAVSEERYGTYSDSTIADYWVGKIPGTSTPLPNGLFDLHTTPKLPTSWASELIRFWAWHVDRNEVAAHSDAPQAHKDAINALVGLQVYGTGPGDEIRPEQAQLFWYSERKLAEALTKLSPWKSPVGTVGEAASKAAAKIAEGLKKGAGEVILPSLSVLKYIAVAGAILGIAYLASPYILKKIRSEG